MRMLHRRSFLERLGLGAGATILSPIVKGLVSEAQGAVPTRRRFIVITFSNGGWAGSSDFGDSGGTCPANLRAQDGGPNVVQTKDWTMLPRYQPLEKYRSKMLLVDGLSNQNGNGSHTNYDLLTCTAKAKGGDVPTEVSPGSQSLDQFVAPTLSKESPFPSIHLAALAPGPNGGVPFDRPKVMPFGFLGKSRGVPVPVQCSPADAFKAVFPTGVPKMDGGPPAPRTDLAVRKRVLDLLNDDVKRIQANFGGPEREKLDQYLSAIDEAQKRTTLAAQATPTTNNVCQAPTLPGAMATPEQTFAAQIDLGTAAIACGMTNVLTVHFIGDGLAFSNLFPEFPNGIDLHKMGHNDYAPKSGTYAEATLVWWSTQVARMVDRLSQVREGDGTLFDNSTILFASDNNEFHHAFGERAPVLLLGSAGGKLKADGRYVRYPMMGGYKSNLGQIRAVGTRGVGDLMATLAQALGSPVDKWGTTGVHPERLQGPLAELL